jgi:hypothetical protein
VLGAAQDSYVFNLIFYITQVHFYAFLFFEDWHTDLWVKRFVRDHLRYLDEIQCAAAVSFSSRERAYIHDIVGY